MSVSQQRKVLMPETANVGKKLPRKTRCFRCDGTGLICDICGESETACSCLNDGQEPTYSDCEDCGGTGK